MPGLVLVAEIKALDDNLTNKINLRPFEALPLPHADTVKRKTKTSRDSMVPYSDALPENKLHESKT